jgi:hypothetical protein
MGRWLRDPALKVLGYSHNVPSGRGGMAKTSKTKRAFTNTALGRSSKLSGQRNPPFTGKLGSSDSSGLVVIL